MEARETEGAESTQDRAKVRIFPPLVPILCLALGVGLERLWPSPELAAWPGVESFCRWSGGGLIVTTLGLGLWAEIEFLRARLSPLPWTPTEGLLRGGPYRLSRNPMYLMMGSLVLGFGLHRASLWMLLLAPVAFWLLRNLAILPEERYLESKLGRPYLEYKQRVRRWL